jgi:hypothetical protein
VLQQIRRSFGLCVTASSTQCGHLAAPKLPDARHFFVSRAGQHSQSCGVAWSGGVSSELQTKLEKYEGKVAHCERAAQEARGERAMYEELSRYYTEIATDFRKAIAKRGAA